MKEEKLHISIKKKFFFHLFLVLAVLGLCRCVQACSSCSVRASRGGNFSYGALVLGRA